MNSERQSCMGYPKTCLEVYRVQVNLNMWAMVVHTKQMEKGQDTLFYLAFSALNASTYKYKCL